MWINLRLMVIAFRSRVRLGEIGSYTKRPWIPMAHKKGMNYAEIRSGMGLQVQEKNGAAYNGAVWTASRI